MGTCLQKRKLQLKKAFPFTANLLSYTTYFNAEQQKIQFSYKDVCGTNYRQNIKRGYKWQFLFQQLKMTVHRFKVCFLCVYCWLDKFKFP
nr:hypothetical protein Iba_chr02bCG24070 [Ipomoea batatas]